MAQPTSKTAANKGAAKEVTEQDYSAAIAECKAATEAAKTATAAAELATTAANEVVKNGNAAIEQLAEASQGFNETIGSVAAETTSGISLAAAAALVKRTETVPATKEGEAPTTKQVAIEPEEVLSFKDHGDHVVVVTKDGLKLTGNK